MSESTTRRTVKFAVAAWLNDRFGDQDSIDPMWWKDADDLIKFLRADGIRLVVE